MAKKLSSFEKAFAAARAAGNGTFGWNGKKYTTELKKEGGKDKSAKYAASADTASFTAARDKPRTGGANIASPETKLERTVAKATRKFAGNAVPGARGVRQRGLSGGMDTYRAAPGAIAKADGIETSSPESLAMPAAGMSRTALAKAAAPTAKRMATYIASKAAQARKPGGPKYEPSLSDLGMVGMKKGGAVRGDGCATKGKSKGTMR